MDFDEIREWLDDRVRERTSHQLTPPEWIVLECSWNGQSYAEMKDQGYAVRYLQQIVAPKLWTILTETFNHRIGKLSLKFTLERHFQRDQAPKPLPTPTASSPSPHPFPPTPHYWGPSPDASVCYGRSHDLQALQRWIEEKHYRLITIVGLAGVGKSVLTKRLAETLQDRYWVIWESLASAPSLSYLLNRLLRHLTPPGSIPDSAQSLLDLLIERLRHHRCLIILDGFEAVLQRHCEAGIYLPGYEEYGTFLDHMGSISHKSCVVVNSRELPRELHRNPYSRPFILRGLDQSAASQLFEHLYLVPDSLDVGHHLFTTYAGNPRALQIVAATIRNIYGRRVSQFLQEMKQGLSAAPPDIDHQFQPVLDRLSPLECEVILWLAIAHSPLSVPCLRDLLLSPQSQHQLTGTLTSLLRRSLIEEPRQGKDFTLHPFIRELLIRNLIDRAVQEIISGVPVLLKTHALLNTRSPDYVRLKQRRSLLHPIAERLEMTLGTRRSLVEHLQTLLRSWHTALHETPSYAIGNLVNLCNQLNVPLDHADLSHLYLWQADLSTTRLLGVNLAYADVSTSTFAKSLGSRRAIALDPDGTSLAVGDERGYIQVWQIETGQAEWTYLEQGSAITALCFSPDGQWLMSGDAAGAIRCWHRGQQRCVYTRLEHRNAIHGLDFSPDGQYLISGSQDQTIRVWVAETGQPQYSLPHPGGVEAIALSADGQQIAGVSGDQVHVWALATGTVQETLTVNLPQRIGAIAFTRGGHLVAASADETVIRVWNLRNGQHFSLAGHTDSVQAIAFGPVCDDDPQLLVSSSRDHTLKFWDIQKARLLQTVAAAQHVSTGLTLSRNGARIASNSHERRIQVWDSDGCSRQVLHGYNCRVRSFAISPNGGQIAVGDDQRTIRIWQGTTGQIQQVLTGHDDWVSALAYNSQGTLLASGSEDGYLYLWDIHTGTCITTIPGHHGALQSLCFSPDDALLATGCSDGIVKVWAIASRDYEMKLCGHTHTIGAIAFHPNSTLLASGSFDHTIRLWDLASGKCLHTLTGHQDRVHTLCFDGDTHLVSGSYDRTVRHWDIRTGACEGFWAGEADLIHSLGRSATGDLYVSGNQDGVVTLWNLTTQTPIGSLRRTSNITWAGFSPEGDRLITVQDADMIQTWDVATQRSLRLIRATAPYQSMNITGLTGPGSDQRHLLKLLGAVEDEQPRFRGQVLIQP